MNNDSEISREHAKRIPDPVFVMGFRDWQVRSFKHDLRGFGCTRESAMVDYEKKLAENLQGAQRAA